MKRNSHSRSNDFDDSSHGILSLVLTMKIFKNRPAATTFEWESLEYAGFNNIQSKVREEEKSGVSCRS